LPSLRGDALNTTDATPHLRDADQSTESPVGVGAIPYPELADLHTHRENGSSSYIWHLFDRLDDLRPLLKP
jgi:hypothetical protein